MPQCWPSWMVAIIRNHENGWCFPVGAIKPNTTTFGSIHNIDILSAILNGSHYQKLQKWLSFFLDEDRDVHYKLSLYNINMLLDILDGSYCEKSQTWLPFHSHW